MAAAAGRCLLMRVSLFFSWQMNELNKRMYAIESLLSRLEEKITPADEVRRGVTPAQLVLFELMFLLSPCRPPVWVRMRKRS